MISYADETAAHYREDPSHHNPPPTCPRCTRPFSDEIVRANEDDAASECFDCQMQALDAGFLADAAERGIEDMADGLRDYLAARRLIVESPETRALVNAIADALYSLRSTLHGRAPRPTSCCDASVSSPEPDADGSGREQSENRKGVESCEPSTPHNNKTDGG